MSMRCGKKLATTFLTTLFAVALPCVTQAVPSISSTSGIFAEGNTVTINGSGFGTSGPNIVLFDNFEGGTNGQTIKTGTGSATIGQWTNGQGTRYYTNSTKVSGHLAFQADHTYGWSHGVNASLPTPVTQGQEIFATWWLYIPAGDRLPGESGCAACPNGGEDGINWKQVWIMQDTSKDDLVVPTMLGTTNWNINGNNSPYSHWLSTSFTKGRWTRYMVWMKVGYANDGNVHFWDLTDSGPVQKINDNNVSVLNNGGSFLWYKLNPFGRQCCNCHPTFDDVYVATGTNTRARIEIGNQPTYNASTKLAISTVTSWSNTNITFTFRQGSFTNGEQAYLFVFDGNGQGSTTGLPFIVAGSGSESLSVPTNLIIVK